MIFIETYKALIKNPSREEDKREVSHVERRMRMNNEIVYPTEKGIQSHNET
jgi:hypothetical protein